MFWVASHLIPRAAPDPGDALREMAAVLALGQSAYPMQATPLAEDWDPVVGWTTTTDEAW